MRYIWLFLYVVSNIALTLHNKFVLNQFDYPWLLTALHSIMTYIGVSMQHSPTQLTAREWKTIYYFSSLYTVNIAVSNWSLLLSSVHFHQIIRSSTPFVTVILNLFYGKTTPFQKILALIPVVVGVMMSAGGEVDYTIFGFILVWVGVVLSALKGVVTNQVMVGPLKLHPMDALLKLCPLAATQCFFIAIINGEVIRLLDEPPTYKIVLSLVFNGFIAYLLNVASFTANKLNGALTMTVFGNVKQIVTIILSVVIFSAIITPMNAIGIALTLFGGILYSWTDFLTQKFNYLPLTRPKASE
eukprot:NODE_469_length_8093_cov_0.306230.p4 type:complete len:300 gc:universal NODE_469_length_8093_cov_0.306230:5195-6094(+)